jgi:hypothetical protein
MVSKTILTDGVTLNFKSFLVEGELGYFHCNEARFDSVW